jgi:hypothetical protein
MSAHSLGRDQLDGLGRAFTIPVIVPVGDAAGETSTPGQVAAPGTMRPIRYP